MKQRQANKIVRKSAETDLRWKDATIHNAYQNATAEAYLASARKWFDRLATAAALLRQLSQLQRQKDNECL
jgi:hypothetical protein